MNRAQGETRARPTTRAIENTEGNTEGNTELKVENRKLTAESSGLRRKSTGKHPEAIKKPRQALCKSECHASSKEDRHDFRSGRPRSAAACVLIEVLQHPVLAHRPPGQGKRQLGHHKGNPLSV